MLKNQKGVGLMEVLVALLVLAIAVLGFVALQTRAISATNEAINNVDAINLARDLAEKIRANPSAYSEYIGNLSSASPSATAATCVGIQANCSNTGMADYDTADIVSFAKRNGMQVQIKSLTVAGTTQRNYLYVSWDKTNPTQGSSSTDCTKTDGTYTDGSQCIIMELY
ncbi:type IV pilus modification protein PilV [Acinetobacter nectaris]|uniref:type IV pilus modification protein PilV n=1 Tax=Acinetobacter nectaris TaxID=1219382 RepID=UPI001F45467E|nr:type IV pilus modification protein PilV [Acinetobacter nectaris]MCF9034243.1 type IV pilus modification protein PilV [Acinetobacter nectaris]